MSSFIKKIKQNTADYCRQNQANLPVNKEYVAMKAKLAIKSFFDFPESYQDQLTMFIGAIKPQKVYLVGSLASGAGIIPGVTPEAFINLRNKHSHKTRKKKSDIDLYAVDCEGHHILHNQKSEVVNIESLPSKFDPSYLIYENGEYV